MSSPVKKHSGVGRRSSGGEAGSSRSTKEARFHYFAVNPNPADFDENQRAFKAMVGERFGEVAVYFEDADRPRHHDWNAAKPTLPEKNMLEVEMLTAELGGIALREASSAEERAANEKLLARKRSEIAAAKQRIEDQHECDIMEFKERFKLHCRQQAEYVRDFKKVWQALLWNCCTEIGRAHV